MISEVLMHGNDVLIVGDFNIRQYKPDIDKNEVFTDDRSVSYTHLTLPTIYSV